MTIIFRIFDVVHPVINEFRADIAKRSPCIRGQETEKLNGSRSKAPAHRPKLRRRPIHDRHRADTVLGAARHYPITVGNVDQHIALAVEEAHDLKCLERKAAVFVEDELAVLEFAKDLDRADLAAGDAGVTRILRHTHGTFHAAGLGPGDVAGDTLDFGVVEAVDHDLIVGAEPSKIRADRAGRPAFGAA
jgi:hypothetical protein